jgi:hypothetical protein
MDEVSLRVELNTVSESRPWTDQGEETLLAAALAATLVEYRRYAGERNEHTGPNGANANWRLMARMEQLRGQA